MPTSPQIMLTVHCKETSAPLFINLAQLRLLPKHEGAAPDMTTSLPEVFTLPRQKPGEYSGIFYVNPAQEEIREVVLTADLDGYLNGVLDSYRTLSFDPQGVLSYLDVAVQCDLSCSADRVVLMQALGAELVITGTFGVRVKEKVAYGHEIPSLLEEAGTTLDEIHLALNAGIDPYIEMGVDVIALPMLQWEHPDNGEPISPVLELLFADPLVMLSHLSRALQND